MSRSTLRLLVLLLLSLTALTATAAPPATLGYQGNLANIAGQPITADLTITFRLYEVPSGGSALWTEVQPNVAVDGGNLAVELGRITPLPRTIWGRQLYLGLQVSGDSEMLPRPALTASPYALRAASTMKRTIVVSAEGTPLENGTALLAAVATITDASAASPVAVEVDAGTFDLGTATLLMPSHTILAGRGQTATVITSAPAFEDNSVTLQLQAHTAVRDLTARNTGAPAGLESSSATGISANDLVSILQPTTDVHLERVTGESIAANGANGQRSGIRLCAANSRAVDITARASGGLFASALRAECQGITRLLIDGAIAQVADARDGVRGVWLTAGFGNEWRRMQIQVSAPPTAGTVFGLRIVFPGAFLPSLYGKLSDTSITIRSDSMTTPTSSARVEGIELNDSAQLALIERVSVDLDGVRARSVIGLRLFERTNNIGATVQLNDVDVRVKALQDSALGFGEIVGIRAEGYPPALIRTRVTVDCVSAGFNPCIGVAQPESWAPVAGTLVLEGSSISVGHVAPADASTRSAALQVTGPTRVENSSLRVRQSATGSEPVRAVRHLAPTAVTQITASILVSTDAANSNAQCLFDGPAGASGEWFDNYVQGSRCEAGQVNLTCAGTTKRGSGFLASTCP